LISQDGFTWTNRSVPTRGNSHNYAFVLWANNEITVVGEMGAIASSPDGITWTIQNAEKPITLFSVAWTGFKYVGVGLGILLSP
jgi:hypothetical protein